MRTKKHYENMLDKNPNTDVGFTLAADMVYAARHEFIDTPAVHADEEWRNIASNLKRKYGESLTVDEVRHEMSPIVTAARALGSIRTEKKAAAARENGKRGGRPLTKQGTIDRLNAGTDPNSLGFELRADDGQGNEYWVREQGAILVRLNCFEDEDGERHWDDDVSGWEK